MKIWSTIRSSRLVRDKSTLAASLLSRVVSGVASLIMLAWFLPVRDYGLAVTIIAYGQLIGLLSSFGFTVQLLRDISERPDEAGQLFAAAIRVKNVLVLLLSAVCGLAMAALDRIDYASLGTIALLYASGLALSYVELAAQAFRGLGRYATEAISAILGNLAYLIAVGVCFLAFRDLAAVALSLALARLAQIALALAWLARLVPLGNLLIGRIADMAAFFRASWSLGVDSTMTSVAGQIDIPLVSAVLGLPAAATYQIVSRFASYALMPAQILMGVYLPRLAATGSGVERRGIERAMQREFAVAGVLFGLGTLAFSQVYPLLVKQQFEPDRVMWVGFAVYVAVRYFVATRGALLIVWRQISWRIWGQVLTFAVLLGGFPLILPRTGVAGAPWLLALSILAAGVSYTIGYGRARARQGAEDA